MNGTPSDQCEPYADHAEADIWSAAGAKFLTYAAQEERRVAGRGPPVRAGCLLSRSRWWGVNHLHRPASAPGRMPGLSRRRQGSDLARPTRRGARSPDPAIPPLSIHATLRRPVPPNGVSNPTLSALARAAWEVDAPAFGFGGATTRRVSPGRRTIVGRRTMRPDNAAPPSRSNGKRDSVARDEKVAGTTAKRAAGPRAAGGK
jgi:hypothetical protein